MPYVCYAQSAQYELLGESSAQTLDWRPEQSLQLHPYCCHERLLNDGFEERCVSGLFCIRYDCASELYASYPYKARRHLLSHISAACSDSSCAMIP